MILLTGATGFLGHNLVPRLVAAGHQVRALVRPTSNVDFLKTRKTSDRTHLISGDDVSLYYVVRIYILG